MNLYIPILMNTTINAIAVKNSNDNTPFFLPYLSIILPYTIPPMISPTPNPIIAKVAIYNYLLLLNV
jgi:hypothetical protein